MNWHESSATFGAMTAADIDLGAIGDNVELIGKHTDAQIMAVVKANGFGHGSVPTALVAVAHGASWLGVTSCAEALELRSAGITTPILCWMSLPGQDFHEVIESDVDISVSSVEHLCSVSDSAAHLGARANVHLKVDTGLSRNGAGLPEWSELVAIARRCEKQGSLRVRGMWSHLAKADVLGHASVRDQVRLFDSAVSDARAGGLDPEILHLANSAAVFGHSATHYDMVRPGIALYGVEPVRGEEFGLRPAMTLRARVIMAKRVAAGTGVSYGHQYTTPRTANLALVPLGFADGVPRTASNRGEVWINGSRHPVAGLVAMDQFVVDAGDTPTSIGDEVVLFGPGEHGEPTVAEWAEWAGTNPHEILTGIGQRVPRRYLPVHAAIMRRETRA